MPQLVADVGAGLHQRREAAVRRHAAHHDHVIDSPAVAVHDVGHAEVDVGGEAPVQLDLASARLLSGFPGAEVEESQVDRLADLVRLVADERDHRAVGLGQRRWSQTAVRRRSGYPRRPGAVAITGHRST